MYIRTPRRKHYRLDGRAGRLPAINTIVYSPPPPPPPHAKRDRAGGMSGPVAVVRFVCVCVRVCACVRVDDGFKRSEEAYYTYMHTQTAH